MTTSSNASNTLPSLSIVDPSTSLSQETDTSSSVNESNISPSGNEHNISPSEADTHISAATKDQSPTVIDDQQGPAKTDDQRTSATAADPSAASNVKAKPTASYWLRAQHVDPASRKKETLMSERAQNTYTSVIDGLGIPQQESFMCWNGRYYPVSYMVEQRTLVPVVDKNQPYDVQYIAKWDRQRYLHGPNCVNTDCSGWTDKEFFQKIRESATAEIESTIAEVDATAPSSKKDDKCSRDEKSRKVAPVITGSPCNPSRPLSDWKKSEPDEETMDWYEDVMLNTRESDTCNIRTHFARLIVKPRLDHGRCFSAHDQADTIPPSVLAKIAVREAAASTALSNDTVTPERGNNSTTSTTNDINTSEEGNTDKGASETVTAVGTQEL